MARSLSASNVTSRLSSIPSTGDKSAYSCQLSSSSVKISASKYNLYQCSLTSNGFRQKPLNWNAKPKFSKTERFQVGRVVAEVIKDDGVKWWEKGGPDNFREINSTKEFIDALSNAGDKLVIMEFFGSWCGSCKALYPKLCKIAESRPDIEFYKINFDMNKPMCKRLNIRVLPFFHFYRGAEGRLDSFSASISKIQRLKDAIEIHGTDRCSLGPPVGVGDIDLLGASNPPTANAV